MWNLLAGSIVSLVGDTLKRVLPERMSEKEKAEIQAKLTAELMQADWKRLEKQAEIIIAETKGGWLQRNWRPILMLTIVTIVANNYIIYPYLSLLGIPATPLQLPEKLWSLMTLGVSGYIVGRSAEKIVERWKGKRWMQ